MLSSKQDKLYLEKQNTHCWSALSQWNRARFLLMKVTIRKGAGPLLFSLTTEGSERSSYFNFYF